MLRYFSHRARLIMYFRLDRLRLFNDLLFYYVIEKYIIRMIGGLKLNAVV